MDLKSGMPFWLIKDGLMFNYPKLENDLEAEVVILGGGISGALSAYYLSKAGIDCVVIDARTIGLGSTYGPYKLLPNSYFSLGFGGNGITFSLIAAEIITDMLLGKENADAKIFAFERV